MTDREKLMRKIQMHDFMLFEVALYLDTHKTDQEALRFYQKHKSEAEQLTAEYVSMFGPLKLGDSRNETSWEWTDGPWPWEYAAN